VRRSSGAGVLQSESAISTALSRFTDAFRVKLRPVVFIVRADVLAKVTDGSALLSFLNLVAVSFIPYARALSAVYRNSHHINYSNSFWQYPWMVNNGHLTLSTPALSAFHVVEEFFGQSSPELSEMELRGIDQPLFDALIVRWKRHFFGKRSSWKDRALFRSLNMAFQAAQLPAGVGTTLYDLGRSASLWVSAFEILAHPRNGKSGLGTVYPLLEKVAYENKSIRERRYAAYMNGRKPWPRRTRSSWLYGKLYLARCDFLHGNPISSKTLAIAESDIGLYWLAPVLYRIALTGALDLIPKKRRGKSARAIARDISSRMYFLDPQETIERALLPRKWKRR
jgi:hypothetical protein